jgi:hypothetical protein
VEDRRQGGGVEGALREAAVAAAGRRQEAVAPSEAEAEAEVEVRQRLGVAAEGAELRADAVRQAAGAELRVAALRLAVAAERLGVGVNPARRGLLVRAP